MSQTTVIIPCYNGEAFLGQALSSVATQTRPAAEILVIDDGSHVPLQQPVHWAGPPLRIIRTENRGLAAARNLGITEATTRYVAFLDADDWWAPEKLALQEEVLDQHAEAVAVYTRCVAQAGCFGFGPYPPLDVSDTELTRVLWYNNFFPPSSVMARRDAILQVGLFRVGMLNGEDLELWMRLLAVGRILQVPAEFTYYRVHEGQLTANVFRKVYGMKQARQNIIDHHANILIQAGIPRERLWDAYRNEVLMVYYRRQFGPARQLLWHYWREHPWDREIGIKAIISLLPSTLVRRLRGGLPTQSAMSGTNDVAASPSRPTWDLLVRQSTPSVA